MGHMCSFGMAQWDKEGIGLIKKPTGLMTNSPEIAKKLDKKCKGGTGI